MKNPYNLVADALGCDPDTLDETSSINHHPSWDSFGQVKIILAIEEEYKVDIPDDEVELYYSMSNIVKLYSEMIKRSS